MTQWEYLSFIDANLEKMNELGRDGWENIGIYPMAGSALAPNDIHMMFLFKRPKVQTAPTGPMTLPGPQFLAETYRAAPAGEKTNGPTLVKR